MPEMLPATAQSDTAAVRPGEELDAAALGEYLRGKVEGIADSITVEQFPGGHSNLTYLLRSRGHEYVLRRGPLGPVAPKAHDMAREYHVLQAVHPHFPEAPDVYHLCQDATVIGSVFYVMERRRGSILRERIPAEIVSIRNHPQLISRAFIGCMARLHSIDIVATGLIALGKPEGFLERQVRGWAERWSRAKTDDAPDMDRVIAWLAGRMPQSAAPTLVHNDYKLDNVMFRNGSAEIIEAVLDWEMTAVGDPLVDLGLTLCYWSWLSAPELRAAALPAFTSQPGWYTRNRFIERYAERTGRDLTHIAYYEVLGIFKLAVILQQIFYRFHRGQTADERFRDFDKRVHGLIRLAVSLVEKQG